MFTPEMSGMVPFISRLITRSLFFGRKVLQQAWRREKDGYKENERHIITCGSYWLFSMWSGRQKLLEFNSNANNTVHFDLQKYLEMEITGGLCRECCTACSILSQCCANYFAIQYSSIFQRQCWEISDLSPLTALLQYIIQERRFGFSIGRDVLESN